MAASPLKWALISRFVAAPFNDYEATGRVDVRLTSKDNFFGRYIFQKTINDGVNFGLGISVGDWQVIPGKSQQIGLDWTHTFSNVFVNQVRLSFSRASSFFNEGSFKSCNDQNPLACPAEIDLVGNAPQDLHQHRCCRRVPAGADHQRLSTAGQCVHVEGATHSTIR